MPQSNHKVLLNQYKKPAKKRLISQADFSKYQEELEERLYAIQERLNLTRQYIRAIRHEYEGNSREAIEHYVDVITDMSTRVTTYCVRNYTENYPVFESFLTDIEDEYYALVMEGGFSEEEVYEYVYGNYSIEREEPVNISINECISDSSENDTPLAQFENMCIN